MFETTFPETGGQASADFASPRGELRAFDWAELCARITATSELRRVLTAARSTGGFANFAQNTLDEAKVIAPETICERPVNLDASRNRKPCSAKASGTSPEYWQATQADRNER